MFYDLWPNKPTFDKKITSKIAYAPWYTVPVNVLNLYWPAVSQIWSLSLKPSTLMTLTLKSIPIVAMWFRFIYEWMYLSKIFVFPTEESPINANFAI